MFVEYTLIKVIKVPANQLWRLKKHFTCCWLLTLCDTSLSTRRPVTLRSFWNLFRSFSYPPQGSSTNSRFLLEHLLLNLNIFYGTKQWKKKIDYWLGKLNRPNLSAFVTKRYFEGCLLVFFATDISYRKENRTSEGLDELFTTELKISSSQQLLYIVQVSFN